MFNSSIAHGGSDRSTIPLQNDVHQAAPAVAQGSARAAIREKKKWEGQSRSQGLTLENASQSLDAGADAMRSEPSFIRYGHKRFVQSLKIWRAQRQMAKQAGKTKIRIIREDLGAKVRRGLPAHSHLPAHIRARALHQVRLRRFGHHTHHCHHQNVDLYVHRFEYTTACRMTLRRCPLDLRITPWTGKSTSTRKPRRSFGKTCVPGRCCGKILKLPLPQSDRARPPPVPPLRRPSRRRMKQLSSATERMLGHRSLPLDRPPKCCGLHNRSDRLFHRNQNRHSRWRQGLNKAPTTAPVEGA